MQGGDLTDYFSKEDFDKVLVAPTDSAFQRLFEVMSIKESTFLKKDNPLVVKVSLTTFLYFCDRNAFNHRNDTMN